MDSPLGTLGVSADSVPKVTWCWRRPEGLNSVLRVLMHIRQNFKNNKNLLPHNSLIFHHSIPVKKSISNSMRDEHLTPNLKFVYKRETTITASLASQSLCNPDSTLSMSSILAKAVSVFRPCGHFLVISFCFGCS